MNKITKGLLLSLLATSSVANADLLDDIKKKGEIVIATEARYAPFEMLDGKKIVGYNKDLMDEVLKDLPGVKLKQLDLPFSNVLPGLANGSYDFVVTALTINKKRAKKFAFTYPVSTASVAIMKRKGDDRIKESLDISGLKAGVQTGAAQMAVMKDYDKNEVIPKRKKGITIQAFPDYNKAYNALANGRVDFVPQAIPNAAYVVKQRPDDFEIIEPAFGPATYYAWAGRKDDDSKTLVKFFSDGIEKLNKNGKMAELQQKWFGYTMKVPTGEVPKPVH